VQGRRADWEGTLHPNDAASTTASAIMPDPMSGAQIQRSTSGTWTVGVHHNR